jgi:monothiol glutaredoxin
MPRPILSESRIHSAIQAKVSNLHGEIVAAVQTAVATHPVVVVGMGMNPMPKRVRKALDAAGVPYHYMEYGNYFNTWRKRNALKMWTGWPTFPMVFVKGILVGGATDVDALIASGELKRMLA